VGWPCSGAGLQEVKDGVFAGWFSRQFGVLGAKKREEVRLKMADI